jgi:hypothetical protein
MDSETLAENKGRRCSDEHRLGSITRYAETWSMNAPALTITPVPIGEGTGTQQEVVRDRRVSEKSLW